MQNNMENLVGRKIKYIDDNEFMWFGRKESYEIEHQDSTHFYLIDDNGIRNAIEKNRLNTHFEILIDEPQFKKGDKVLVSYDGVEWLERIFVIKYKDFIQCESKHHSHILTNWVYIKPYEDEIKVGDWVVNTHHGSVFKNDTINLGINHPNRYKKITNPELIELLNKEL